MEVGEVDRAAQRGLVEVVRVERRHLDAGHGRVVRAHPLDDLAVDDGAAAVADEVQGRLRRASPPSSVLSWTIAAKKASAAASAKPESLMSDSFFQSSTSTTGLPGSRTACDAVAAVGVVAVGDRRGSSSD